MQMEQAMDMLKMAIPGEDVSTLRMNIQASHDQAMSLLREVGNNIITFIDQDEKKNAAREVAKEQRAAKGVAPQQAYLASMPALPNQQPQQGAETETDLDRIAESVFSSSFGGAHKLTPDQSYEMAAALLVERGRRREE